MADPLSFRLDGDIAAITRVHAERAGVTHTAYVHELLRFALGQRTATYPEYIPLGHTDHAGFEFENDLVLKSVSRVWVWRDLCQPSRVWMMQAELEVVTAVHVRLRPAGGYALAVPRSDIVAWSPQYKIPHDYVSCMFDWSHAGAVLHAFDTSGFGRQLAGQR